MVAGSYHLRQHQEVSLRTPRFKQESYLQFQEVRFHFLNFATILSVKKSNSASQSVLVVSREEFILQ